MKFVIASLVVLLLSAPAFAGPRVEVVIGDKAPALEQLAADELANQLQRVYEADVKISSTTPADAPHVIFVGSPDTNTSMKPFAAQWPSGDKKLTDQGHLLRSVTHRDRPALLIGGGSPVATYWAVSEFGHRLGIRSMLYGDLDPISPPEFTLQGIDVVQEPRQRVRGWRFANHSPHLSGAWGLDEYRRVIGQLAKLKFNRISVEISPGVIGGNGEPFVQFEYAGLKRTQADLWGGRRYPVSGDTSGRKVFAGAKFFENPDFEKASTFEDLLAAGEKLLRGIIDAAQLQGMTAVIRFQVARIPHEFGPVFKGEKFVMPLPGVVIKDFEEASRHPEFIALTKTLRRAYFNTYPQLDGVELQFPTENPKRDLLERLLDDSDLPRAANGRDQEIRYVTSRGKDSFTVPFVTADKPESKAGIMSISSFDSGDLPTLRLTDLVDHLGAIRAMNAEGYSIQATIGDFDLNAYWLSRVSCDESLTLSDACHDLLEPVCGAEVDQRVFAAFRLIEKATRLELMDESRFGYPILRSRVKHRAGEIPPAPAYWAEMREHYLNAMNEMYRANTRAREGGRSFTLYWARRCEFAYEALNSIEARRKAEIAEQKQDTATQITELEKAIESLNNALNALAAVARSNSDRGLIAVLNEDAYRPLKKSLTEAEAAAK